MLTGSPRRDWASSRTYSASGRGRGRPTRASASSTTCPPRCRWRCRARRSRPRSSRFLRGVPGPIGIHGFAIWAAAAALAGRAVSRRGLAAVPLASAYGTRAYEVAAMQDGFVRELGPAPRFKYRAWLQWIRAVDDRVEGWGYARSRAVLVNYESVARILDRAYGLGPTVRLVPYASEDAFDEPGGVLAGTEVRRPRPARARGLAPRSPQGTRRPSAGARGAGGGGCPLPRLPRRLGRAARVAQAAGGGARAERARRDPREGRRRRSATSPRPTCSCSPRSPRQADRSPCSRRCGRARAWSQAPATGSRRISRTAPRRCWSRRETRTRSPAPCAGCSGPRSCEPDSPRAGAGRTIGASRPRALVAGLGAVYGELGIL